MVNIRDKGQRGEREIATLLNGIIYQVAVELGFSEEDCLKAVTTVQRNQNQTAVGGNDLTNCFGMSIEVKRQEQLSINTWWKQCVASAARGNELPVLIWKQNRKPWRVQTWANLYFTDNARMRAVVQFDVDTFKIWFAEWVKRALMAQGRL